MRKGYLSEAGKRHSQRYNPPVLHLSSFKVSISIAVMSPPVEDLLEKYKKHPFAKGLLAFRSVIKSLDSPVPAIYAEQDGRQRWVVSY